MTKEEIEQYFQDNKDKLQGQILMDIAVEVGCSLQTVYNYMNDGVKNIHVGKAMVESAKKLLTATV